MLDSKTAETLRTLRREWDADHMFLRQVDLAEAVCNEIARLRDEVESLVMETAERKPPPGGRK